MENFKPQSNLSQRDTGSARFVQEANRSEKHPDSRVEYEIDRDRLLYTVNFARLAEVTQTVSADHGYVFHNRLTHSLKVAQLARRISEKLIRENDNGSTILGGLDAEAAECAALAHDLGHPPFGHIAEDELNDAMLGWEDDDKQKVCKEGFEGNAQSFRIVTRLAVGDPLAQNAETKETFPFLGLNLTRRSLNAILKYPWYCNENPDKKKKWGAYQCDQDFFQFARQDFSIDGFVKSLEAEIMDWSDDITYAVHDVVDFYCAGKIPLETLAEGKNEELDAFFTEVFERNVKRQEDGSSILFGEKFDRENQLEEGIENYKAAFRRVCDEVFSLHTLHYSGSQKQRLSIWQMMTRLITKYVNAIKVSPEPIEDKRFVKIDESCQHEIEMLKQLTWHYVIHRPELATVQSGQRLIVRSLFNKYAELVRKAPTSKSPKLLPGFYDEQLKIEESYEGRIRIVVDYISSMTEREAVSLYQKLFAHKVGPGL